MAPGWLIDVPLEEFRQSVDLHVLRSRGRGSDNTVGDDLRQILQPRRGFNAVHGDPDQLFYNVEVGVHEFRIPFDRFQTRFYKVDVKFGKDRLGLV